ncbi:MAG: nitrate- and nitrite sensing domain-containing protein [Actinophytocola sp.]|uniref:sensor histidine kinase n=1 Tax=Actinophytocola sp. TaxID=1872138 RepID=UPI003C787539
MLAIVLVPSAALLIIGVGASGYLVYDGYDAQKWATTMQDTVPPGTRFAAGAQEERRLSLQVLGGDKSAMPELEQARAEFDQAIAGIKGLLGGLNDLNPEAIEQANKIFPKLIGEQLPQIRQGVDAGVVPWKDVYAFYSGVVDLIKLGLQGIAATAPDSKTAVEESTATTLFAVADSMSRANALAVNGAVDGGLTVETYSEFSRQVGRYHTDMEQVLPLLIPELQQRYTELAKSPEWARLSEVEGALLLQMPGTGVPQLPVTLEEWQEAASVVNTELLDIYSDHHTYAEGFAADTGEETFRNSLLGGGAVLLITLIATFVAIRLSNRVVRRMKKLRMETLELADMRLPRIVQRLRSGEQIDINREVPALDYGNDELGQVAGAFNQAQRTAVAAAAQEAEIQNGVRTVFLNIAHRSQLVVRRQLEVLDKAEREQEDPDQLELLFQLDHLATRARRSAENLLILGGERPGRRWRNPVPLVEIVRSAIGETEHYRRVNTGRMPDLLISGAAVADIIHLLAELVDNATAFSPPESRVEVRSNRVGRGVVVEIEDQGVGLSREERDDINNFLQNPPDFGVMALTEEEARLGLFVISQLASRHGVSVTLVDSAYGGVRAIVLIRSSLIADSGESVPHEEDLQSGTGQTGQTTADLRSDLPAPRQELAEQTATAPPARTRLRASFPDDLSWPEESPAEQTVRWNAWGSSSNGGTPPPPGNGTPPPGTPPPPPPPQDPTVARDMGTRGRAAPDPGPATDGNGRAEGGGQGGKRPLPRRRRQANIAPRLAAEDEPWPGEPDMSEAVDPALLAEKARHRMAALQRGTREGRAAE